MEMPTTTREFWKHKVYGEVYGVELYHPTDGGPRVVLAARKCSRPEEQTRGALPVLTLYTAGTEQEFVANNTNDFGMWEPAMTRDDAVEKLRDKIAERDAAKSHYDKIRKDERAALKTLEKLDADVLVASRNVVNPAEPAPLLAISELTDTNATAPPAPTDAPPSDEQETLGELTPEEFDAAFGGEPTDQPDDLDADAPPSSPAE